MNKPIFKKGQTFTIQIELKCDEEIKIMEVYPAGHRYANAQSNFYLIDSSDSGNDVQSERQILDSLDLFQYPEFLPAKVRKTLEKYSEVDNYVGLNTLLSVIKPMGYTFEYYLDAVPYNLRKL